MGSVWIVLGQQGDDWRRGQIGGRKIDGAVNRLRAACVAALIRGIVVLLHIARLIVGQRRIRDGALAVFKHSSSQQNRHNDQNHQKSA